VEKGYQVAAAMSCFEFIASPLQVRDILLIFLGVQVAED
jgi:hypothetical protein